MCSTPEQMRHLIDRALRIAMAERNVDRFDLRLDPLRPVVSPANVVTQVAQEGVDADRRGILAGVQTLMHSSYGEDPGGGVPNGIGSLRAVHVRYLQTEDARYDLQAVLDPMVDLLQ
jgi:hypothetical protein